MENSLIKSIWDRNKITIKAIVVGFLIMALLIPTLFIMDLVKERSQRQEEVRKEVSAKWATNQTLIGPLLIIPYLEKSIDEDKKTVTKKKLAWFLPETLNINGTLQPQVRYRSIYKIVVYNSTMKIEGNFSPLNVKNLNIEPADLLMQEARLCVGLTDFRGIEDQMILNWNGNNMPFNAGVPANHTLENGLSTSIPISLDNLSGTSHFSLDLKLRGSGELFFVPVGKTTLVHFGSSWNNPSFDGNFLPASKSVTENGFTADWKVLHLNRNYPQSWKDENYNFESSAFGINLLQSTDSYSKTLRSVKYAILFISLSFGLFFFLEILQKRSLHPMQYVLVGLALCIFYTLLLSISEYVPFNSSYAIAGVSTIVLITLYTKSLFTKWSIALLFGGVLAMLYGFIFMLIQLQDGALLFGSIALFLLLGVIMYYSKRIDWYNVDGQSQSQMGML